MLNAQTSENGCILIRQPILSASNQGCNLWCHGLFELPEIVISADTSAIFESKVDLN